MVICTTPFLPLARSHGGSLEHPDPLLLGINHPISGVSDEATRERAREVVEALPAVLAREEQREVQVQVEPDHVWCGPSAQEAFELFAERGWIDGLPIIPPTEAAVSDMLRYWPHGPEDTIPALPPSWVPGTYRKVAVNAVMAGCVPEHFPALIAALRAVADPVFDLPGVQATTHPATPLLVFNGPIRQALGINSGAGLFGPGFRANATIGRALRLVLRNIGGALPGELDMATMTHPGKYTYCIAENEEASPWGPLHADLGHDGASSTVTVLPAEAPHNINDRNSRTAEGLLQTIAGAMAQTGCNNNYYEGHLLLVLCPEHAQALSAGGFSKKDVAEHLARTAVQPMARWGSDQQEVRFRRRWPQLYADADAQTTQIPVIRRADRLLVIVAGGVGKHSVHVPTLGTGQAVTVPIGPIPGLYQ